MSGIGFRCLGTLEVIAEGRSISAGGPLQRGLLAALLLNANRVVTADRIIDALWDKPPDTALGQVQTRVWRLRQMLHDGQSSEGGDERPQLITRAGGYCLMIEPETLDLMAFNQRVQNAQTFLDAERHADALRELRTGLALWRGPAFADVSSPGIRTEAEAIEERRLVAIEQRMEVELALGMHQQVVPELRKLVAAHPFRERLRYQLMRALHLSGQRAEAIAIYMEGYRALVDGLGLEPSRELQDMHREILASDGRLEPASVVASTPRESTCGPQELPRDSICLVGRDHEVADLGGYLRQAAVHGNPRVAAISGVAGVGKSALALRIAHTLSAESAERQFFARIDDEQCVPHAVLGRILCALGVPSGELPQSVEERSALYRARTADMKFVLLIDNATSEAQVRPLLPTSRGSITLITSRRRLTALESVHHLELGRLGESSMAALLARIVGAERFATESDAVHRIVQHCAGLPLALRAIAARICARPHWPLAKFADVLDDDFRRLGMLSFRDLDMRAAIACDYLRISGESRRLFRLLALIENRRFSALDASRLLETALSTAEDVVESLVDERLIRPVLPIATNDDKGGLRYQVDGLWWLFARERLVMEETPLELRHAKDRLRGLADR